MNRWRFFACALLGVLVLAACSREDSANKQTPTTTTPKPEAAQPAGEGARAIELTLSFIEPRFRPDPVMVQVGKPTQFKISSADTRHTLVIDALGIEVEVPQKALNESTLTKIVVPQKAGTFRMFCRIHGRLPMEGTLVVSETTSP